MWYCKLIKYIFFINIEEVERFLALKYLSKIYQKINYLIESEELILGLLFQIGDPGRENILTLVDVVDQVQFVLLQTFLELVKNRRAVTVFYTSCRALKFNQNVLFVV